ncbi:cell division cycle 7-related protein kinase isoform X1 [Nasonia vitripennis]|uniref:non-specific serine/threonine protein kinase n=1 Tax=Nasonia vitripennis TaxID=7425 RepID=A0A7M7G2V1_NASVI|nr:cell division cycle 7-related protein kinase isoform X1 [Nasonia vitripennis]
MDKSFDKSIDESYEDDEKDRIASLLSTVPVLDDLFHIHYKVGEGTFSSVFLATLKNSSQSKNFAVKHLVPTCHPGRIERELQCLKDIGGQDHVVGLELCLRHSGSVVFVMPFMRHDKFSDYVHDMDPQEMKDYMRALLTALRRVHKFNIIHRDIKPSNFLYDRSNKRYLLVDFGLAQQYVEDTKPNNASPKVSQIDSLSGKRKRCDENKIDRTLKAANKLSSDKCYCFGKPKICSLCLARPSQAAPRAGTPGFRAPEVLLKHPSQTPAIDIWACGVMMLSILSGTQPFFRSPDDMTALAEITAIFGSSSIQQLARKLGKKLVYSNEIPGIDLISLCQKLQKRNENSKIVTSETVKEESELKYPVEAYHLIKRLLDINYTTRITAQEALLHPFFNA